MFLQILALLLAIPTGLLIAYLTPEELKSGQKYFKAIIVLSIIAGIYFYLVGQTYVIWASAFIIIATFFSLRKT